MKTWKNEITFSELAEYEESDELNEENIIRTRKRRRTYDETDLELIPYRKKPRMNEVSLLPLEDPQRKGIEECDEIR